MKVKNLYIGSVYKVVNTEYYDDEVYGIACKITSLRERFTLCLVKDLECGNAKVKDIIFGGVYSLESKDEPGYMYMRHLYPVTPILFDVGYTKSDISKGRVKKLLLSGLLNVSKKNNN